MTTIYVGNLPFSATEDDVRQLFEKHGKVESVKLINDRETGRPRGFGFVEMASGDAQTAIAQMNGFNMGGRRYYTFARRHVRFVMLDSNQVEPEQVAWLDSTLREATEPWKVVVFHHPIYSDGNRHGSNVELRVLLEPIIDGRWPLRYIGRSRNSSPSEGSSSWHAANQRAIVDQVFEAKAESRELDRVLSKQV